MFTASRMVTNRLIADEHPSYPPEVHEEQIKAKADIKNQRRSQQTSTATLLKPTLPSTLQYAVTLAQEKGASSWLTTLPVKEFGFASTKQPSETLYAYGWQPTRTPIHCDCGTHFSIEHSLSCPKGGFPTIRHNEIRDITANLLTEVCNDVNIEPHLQPITGERFSSRSANTQDGARLDIGANGL